MKKLFSNYAATFSGLSREVWWLSLITLINRAGTMVIPFLSLYLTQSLGFTLSDVGLIMVFFGLGSVAGSRLGGYLTDRIGYYKVMQWSLFLTGVLFVLLQFIKTLNGFCASIFFLMMVADTFRPAMFVALSSYSKPENKTRSVTLIRLAINLGFSAGPAVGGLIITTMGYQGLFWVDGITCVMATVLLINVLNPRKARVLDEVKVENPVSVYSDKPYWIFLVAMALFGIVFLQYFSTIPLYYKEVHHLSELEIGLLLGANGFIIFLLEMPLVKSLEDSQLSKINLMLAGGVLVTLSFIVLNMTGWVGILLVGMFFMTIGEMIMFPFSNAFAMERAKKGNQGQYMSWYSISFSVAHVFGHFSGMHLIEKVGFDATWYIVFGLSLLSGVFLLILKGKTKSNTVKKVLQFDK
ncbi:putative MFS family arabinose efflux permease [Tenacibaculum skagerrakense]|uniref:Putative MFS family arabinose efflux permease n=1 Tax=Tenacibaculum skagerrakense TaxID=186571 RepID=A0A4R2P1B7_9FLAO|nr:MFS transporter [Tenacibaculum skagerrakense]TCP28469.1 putative MFS family arabinose efflux permease [Tenacibaculum skagerrakense]